MIGFSAFPPSVVVLRFPFPLFLIVLVLSYLLSVPAVVYDGVLRLCKAENSLLPSLGKSFIQITRCFAEYGLVTTKVGVLSLFVAKSSSSTVLHRHGKNVQAVCTLCDTICAHWHNPELFLNLHST